MCSVRAASLLSTFCVGTLWVATLFTLGGTMAGVLPFPVLSVFLGVAALGVITLGVVTLGVVTLDAAALGVVLLGVATLGVLLLGLAGVLPLPLMSEMSPQAPG